jgi:trypsin
MKHSRVLQAGCYSLWLCAVLIFGVACTSEDPGLGEETLEIVGGTVAAHGDWPFIVSLQKGGTHYCAGSMITHEWVVTAKHCGLPDSVLVGPDPSTGVARSVLVRIAHSSEDIALLRLSSPVAVEPALLSCDKGFPIEIDLASADGGFRNTGVAGWGHTSYGGSTSYPTLMEVSLPAITHASCSDAYGGAVKVTELCAGLVQGGQDACQGDSGGPLSFDFGRRFVAGITSWGYECAVAGYPGVYVRVRSVLDFIQANVEASCHSPTSLIVASVL